MCIWLKVEYGELADDPLSNRSILKDTSSHTEGESSTDAAVCISRAATGRFGAAASPLAFITDDCSMLEISSWSWTVVETIMLSNVQRKHPKAKSSRLILGVSSDDAVCRLSAFKIVLFLMLSACSIYGMS
jgi:hypothetical protein